MSAGTTDAPNCSMCEGRPDRGDAATGWATCPMCRREFALVGAVHDPLAVLAQTGIAEGVQFRPEVLEASGSMFCSIMDAAKAHKLDPAQVPAAAAVAVARVCLASNLGSITPVMLADICAVTVKGVVREVPRG